MNRFETKKKLVENGESKVFNNWNKFFGISKEEFLKSLEWVCNDPLNGVSSINPKKHDALTREIAIEANHDAMTRAENMDMTPEQRKIFGQKYDEKNCEAYIVKLHREYDVNADQIMYYTVDDGKQFKTTHFVAVNALDQI